MSVMYSPVLKYTNEELTRNQEMSSSYGNPQQHCHQHNSGLLRYRSAPSSFLTSLIENNNNNNTSGYVNEEAYQQVQQSYVPTTSSEMETMLSKLISSSSNNGWNNSSESLQEFGGKVVKQEEEGDCVPQNGYSSSFGESHQMIYQSQQIQQGLTNGSSCNGFDGSFGVMNSTHSKMDVRNCSNLIRKKSSPAGFFSSENGLAALREARNFEGSEVSKTFSSKPSSCLKRMPQIDENGNENCDQGRNLANDHNGNSKCYMPNFTNEFWDGSALNPQKAESEDEIMFSTSNGLESQEADFCYQNLGLTHHLSLPSSTSKMASMEKFLQIQGSVPCKIRAKRGFATHPRSIAERVRRTRISERIKKLQGLFPKSEKQTSTADMLDLAVEYIKDLQEQVKVLSDCKAKCKCTRNEKQHSRPCA